MPLRVTNSGPKTLLNFFRDLSSSNFDLSLVVILSCNSHSAVFSIKFPGWDFNASGKFDLMGFIK